MLPLHDLSPIVPPLVRALRWLGHVVRGARRPAALTLLVWMLCVAVFAVWTLYHYHVQGAVPWIGMTIRTGAFASWLLVAREWLLIQLQRRAQAASQNINH